MVQSITHPIYAKCKRLNTNIILTPKSGANVIKTAIRVAQSFH
jgi:hypothetical protein